jgi:hypothetical protein
MCHLAHYFQNWPFTLAEQLQLPLLTWLINGITRPPGTRRLLRTTGELHRRAAAQDITLPGITLAAHQDTSDTP